MAFKIVYGAGQTLSSSSDGKFGSGYGFLEMHREDAVKDFAFDILESRLLGNSYHFERGAEWPENKPIVISSFQRCGGWYVLSKLRSIAESRGRAYFLGEFILVTEDEAWELSVRGIVPARILASENDEIWFQGDRWNRPGTWLDDPIDLTVVHSDLKNPSDHLYPAFQHQECLIVNNRADEWTPRYVLQTMENTQLRFVEAYGDRANLQRSADGACLFELAWNSISLTSFYLDPRTGIDLQLTQRPGRLPYTWTGVFHGVQYHDELLNSSNDKVEGTNLLGTEEELLASEWITEAPTVSTPVPEVNSVRNYATVSLESVSGSGVRVRRRWFPEMGSSKKRGGKRGWVIIKWVTLGAGAIALVVFGTNFVSNRKTVKEAVKALETARISDQAGAIYRFINAPENASIDFAGDALLKPYHELSLKIDFLKDTLTFDAEGQVGSVENDEALYNGSSPNSEFSPSLTFLWTFVKRNHEVLSKRRKSPSSSPFDLVDLTTFWSGKKRSELSKAAKNCGVRRQWEEYELTVLGELDSHLGKLVDAEETERKRSDSDSEEEKATRNQLRDSISTIVDYLGADDKTTRPKFASLLARATELNSPREVKIVLNEPATGESLDIGKSEGKGKMNEAVQEGIITRAMFVTMDPGKIGYFPFPKPKQREDSKEGFSEVFLLNAGQLNVMIRLASCIKGELRMPLPQLDSTDGLEEISANPSKIRAGRTEIGDVDTNNQSLFKPIQDKGGRFPAPLMGMVARNTDGEMECWIYLLGEIEQDIEIEEFLQSTGFDTSKSVENVNEIRASLVVMGDKLGDEAMVMGLAGNSALLTELSTVGSALVNRSTKLQTIAAKYAKLEKLKGPANTFTQWFSKESGASTPAAIFFAGLKSWSTDATTGEASTAEMRPSFGDPASTTTSAWSMLGDSKVIERTKNVLGSRQKLQKGVIRGPGELDALVASFIVEICRSAAATPIQTGAPPEIAYFLPKDDPLHEVENLPSGETSLENLCSVLANANTKYKPYNPPPPIMPDPSAQGSRKEGPPPVKEETAKDRAVRLELKTRYDNGMAMKKNWTRVIEELMRLRPFVEAFDGTSGNQNATIAVRIQELLSEILGLDETRKPYDAYIKDLQSGNLSSIQFKLRLQPFEK